MFARSLKHFVTFLPTNKRCSFKKGESLLDVALRNQLDIGHTCGGMGSCTTCRVIVKEGLEKIPSRDGEEALRAEERDFAPEERLACQVEAFEDLVLEIPQRKNKEA